MLAIVIASHIGLVLVLQMPPSTDDARKDIELARFVSGSEDWTVKLWCCCIGKPKLFFCYLLALYLGEVTVE